METEKNFVYLAEPIDYAQGIDGLTVRETAQEIAEKLTVRGWAVFRPASAWTNVPPGISRSTTARDVIEINRMALHAAGLVVAVLPDGSKSVGVPMEIAWATDRNIPVVVFTGKGSQSTMLHGNPLVVVLEDLDNLDGAIEVARSVGPVRSAYTPINGRVQRVLPYEISADHPLYPDGLVRHYLSDAALDLITTTETRVLAGDYASIPCGVKVELPDDVFGWVVARSSTFKNWGIVVTPGVIDSGFRGELAVLAYRPQIRVEKLTTRERVENLGAIPAGTRLAQLVLLPNVTRGFDPVRVEQILSADRGTNGFGSTGRGIETKT